MKSKNKDEKKERPPVIFAEFAISLKPQITWAPDFKAGYINMTCSDCSADIVGNKGTLGTVSGCFGGGVEIRDGETTYKLTALAIWKAFQEAKFAHHAGKEERKARAILDS